LHFSFLAYRPHPSDPLIWTLTRVSDEYNEEISDCSLHHENRRNEISVVLKYGIAVILHL
jgi:hypothetical protein